VFLASWEIECCQPPPGVDDTVAWRLRWVDRPTGPGLVTLPWQKTVLPPAAPGAARGLYLHHDGLNAWWPDAAPDAVAATGWLVVAAHGPMPEELPPTVGLVVGVRVVEQTYRRESPRSYKPAADDFTLRAVQRSPMWFDRGRMPIPPSTKPGPESFRAESGVLVSLLVDGPIHQSH